MSNYICPICRDYLIEPVDVPPEEVEEFYPPVLTYCGHIFHDACITEWLDTQSDEGAALKCPTCFSRVLKGDLVIIYPSIGDHFVDYITLLNQVKTNTQDLKILCDELTAANLDLHQILQQDKERSEKVAKLTKIIHQLQNVSESWMEKFGAYLTRSTSLEAENKSLETKLEENKKFIKEKQLKNNESKATLDAIQLHLKGSYDVPVQNIETQQDANAQCSSKENVAWKYTNSKEILDKIKSLMMLRKQQVENPLD